MHVQASLTALVESGLVRRSDDIDLAYWFKHVLTQETAYSTLLRQDRRVLHRLLGDIYRALFADDLDNYLLPLAFHYAEAGDTLQAFQFLIRYGEYATRISAYPEAIDAFRRALDVLRQDEDTLRAPVHIRLGDIYRQRAEYELAKSNFDTALLLARRAGDAVTSASALSGLARVATQQGEPVQARELGERALECALEANATEAIGRAHRQLGISYNLEGNNALARSHLQEALDLYRALGDVDGISDTLNSLGIVAREEQDTERAWICFQDALAYSQQRGDKYSTGIRLTNLAVVAEQRGDFDTASDFLVQAHSLALEIGDREGAALTELNLGSLALTRDDLPGALKHYQFALAETVALNAIPFALYVIAAIAKWQLVRGNPKLSAELFGLALSHPSSTADIAIDFDLELKSIKTTLGEAEFAAATARGTSSGLQATVQEIIKWTS